MAEHALDILRERGFLKQITFEDDLYELLKKKSVTFYVGFDPTADSLHVGHFIPVMAMAHMQRAGHRPIAMVGSGTAVVGDPSFRTDMRQMLTLEQIAQNAKTVHAQLERFMSFEGENAAIMVNNADWLMKLNYLEFLRDIGVHFSVNRMLTADCYRARMEKGLSFLEFNYMLMQAYDFLKLHDMYDCQLQMGGDDQWSNILAGADLIRRKEQKPAFACTLALLLKSDGEKMGKTASGALWLSAERTPAYDFYQYWRNVDDQDVETCLMRLTFLPMDEIKKLAALRDREINIAKRALAFEATALVHGREAAELAQKAAEALFEGGADAEVPGCTLTAAQIGGDDRLLNLLALCGLCASKGEARRLIAAGGVYVDGDRIVDPDARIDMDRLANGVLLRKGKKGYCRLDVQ